MQVRDRVKELRRVKASELKANPRNWRTHPPEQHDALSGLLAEIGYADALIARELADGSLELIDGHLRKETTPDMPVPVLVLDVSEAEADKLLAALDPLGAMAGKDVVKLDALLAAIETDSAGLQALLDELKASAAVPPAVVQAEPVLASEAFVELRCSQAQLEKIRPTLEGWERDGFTINIA